MLSDEFIKKNFLNPSESNQAELLKKIKRFLEVMGNEQKKYQPIRKRSIDFKTEDIFLEEIPMEMSTDEAIENHLVNIFQGAIRWHSPFALLNIAPPPILDAVAASTIASLYNQNSLWDLTSGNTILYEKKIIKALCELVEWEYKNADGLNASGGKATLLYAIKIGLHKCRSDIIEKGIKDDYYVIASDRSHYSLEDVCNFLGMGSNNLIRIPTNIKGQIIVSEFNKSVENLVRQGKNIACVILNCGITIDMCVDPIVNIKNSLISLAKKYSLSSIPHLHADSVAGWAWLFFKKDNLGLMKNIDGNIKRKIENMYSLVKQIKECDSFSADFHKTGLVPYCSTFFITKAHEDIFSLTKKGASNLKKLNELGDFHAHFFTLENSRSSVGIVSAWIILQKLGYIGFQKYLIKMISIGNNYKQIIQENFAGEFEVINLETQGFETLIKINFFNDNKTWAEMVSLSSEEDKDIYKALCLNFKNFLYGNIFDKNIESPLIGYVPMYQMQTIDPKLPCFLLYPMSVYTDIKDTFMVIQSLLKIKKGFESGKNYQDLIRTNIISNRPPPPR